MDTLIDPTKYWWSYPVSKDVVVEVRCDSSPWRLKQIRSLIAQMIRQLNENEKRTIPVDTDRGSADRRFSGPRPFSNTWGWRRAKFGDLRELRIPRSESCALRHPRPWLRKRRGPQSRRSAAFLWPRDAPRCIYRCVKAAAASSFLPTFLHQRASAP